MIKVLIKKRIHLSQRYLLFIYALDDADAIFKGDPAAESIDEVILAYPGFMAIFIYRWPMNSIS